MIQELPKYETSFNYKFISISAFRKTTQFIWLKSQLMNEIMNCLEKKIPLVSFQFGIAKITKLFFPESSMNKRMNAESELGNDRKNC